MLQNWNVLLREKVNETDFILAKYQNFNSKDQYSCIVSAMDWIDVGMTNIDKALDELKESNGLETCMKFYQYICCIDMVWGGICQLHRVFINRETKPFENEANVFKKKYFEEDDNRYFEEIRSCFGAHPVELKTRQTNKKQDITRKFASWSTHYGTSQEMSVLIYSNIPNSGFDTVTVTVDELQEFYENRCQYIQVIMNTIDSIVHCYKEDMKNSAIPKSNDLKVQIEILKSEALQRFGGNIFIEELEQIEHFLSTKFFCKKNREVIEKFSENIILGINEIYNCLQSMNADCILKISKVLLPKLMPKDNNFGEEFANLYLKVIPKVRKDYDAKTIKRALGKYVCFEYKTEDELYWLTVMALNLAQEDLKEEAKYLRTDMVSVLECIDTILKIEE